MKWHRFSDFLLRALSATSEATIIYLIFLVFNILVGANLPTFNCAYLILIALIGCVLGSFEYKNYILAASGVLVGVGLSVLVNRNLNILNILLVAIVLLIAWLRGFIKSRAHITEILLLEHFYRYMVLILTANIIIYLSNPSKIVAQYVTWCTILYIVISLYLIFRLKSRKYSETENKKNEKAIDIILAMSMIILTFILASPSILGGVLASITYVYHGLEKLVGVIMEPIAYVISLIILMILRLLKDEKTEGSLNQVLSKMEAKNSQNVDWSANSTVNWVADAMSALILLVIFISIVVYIVKYVTKLNQKNAEDEFTEDREFVIDITKLKNSIPQYLKNAKDRVIDTLSKISLNASAKERIRYEYKKLLKVLHNKGMVDKNTYTAQKIFELVCMRLPEIEESMKAITGLYEEVRYGDREPQDGELASFKQNIKYIITKI